MAKLGTWVKNFGRSAKFGAKEVATELAPSITGTFTYSNLDIIKSLRSIRKFNRLILRTAMGEDTYDRFMKTAEDAKTQALKDIKSGQFIKENTNPFGGEEDFGFDDNLDNFGGDFDSGEEDFGFSEGGEEEGGESAPSSSEGEGGGKVAPVIVDNELPKHQIQELSGEIGAQTAVMSAGFATVAETTKKMTNIDIAISRDLMGRQIAILDNINTNISNLVQFNNDTMSKFVMAAMKYYEDSLGHLAKLAGAGGGEGEKEEGSSERDESDYSLLFRGDSAIDLEGLQKVLARNLKSTFSDSMFGSMIAMLDNDMLLNQFAQNPLGFLMNMGISQLIPKVLKNSVTELDKSVKAFFPALMGKFATLRDSDNKFYQMIGELFGIKSSTGYSIDLGNYEKGAVSFDGITRKAIIEVIPTYLRKILSAVSGREEMAFDYEKGTFASLGEMREESEKKINDKYLSGAYKTTAKVNRFIDSHIQFESKAEEESYKKAQEKFFINLMKSGGYLNVKNIKEFTDLGMDERYAKLLQSVMSQVLSKSELMDMMRQSQSAINDIRNFNNELSEKGDASFRYNWLNNGMGDEPDKEINPYDETGQTYRIHNKLFDRYMSPRRPNTTGGKDSSDGWAIRSDDSYSKTDINKNLYGTYEKKREKYTEEERNAEKVAYSYMSGADNDTIARLAKEDKENAEEKTKKSYPKMIQSLIDIFKKPETYLAKGMDKIVDSMYTIIFGTEDNKSVLTVALDQIKLTFTNFRKWITENIYTPIKNFFFGQDFYKSKFYTSLTAGFGSLKDIIFGKKDAAGVYSGGLLSESVSTIKDIFSFDSKGGGEGILDLVKSDIKSIGTSLKERIFGSSDESEIEGGDKRPLIDKLFDTIGTGINNFRNLIFGNKFDTEEDKKQAAREFTEDFKSKMPKMASTALVGAGVATVGGFAGWGMLGNLFLPGGPIGGAVLGAAIGLARQSDSFKKFAFGDAETGKEGVVPKKFISWWNDNRKVIMGGAALGTLKGIFGMSIIPSMLSFIPGVGFANMILGSTLGPVFGGIGMALALKSQAVQTLLFGKEDASGEKVGGLVNSDLAKQAKHYLPNMIVGGLGMSLASSAIGSMGIIGSMAVSGPIPASILGAAMGIAAGSEKMQKYLFGEEDENGDLRGGMFDKLSNYISIELWKPFKLKAEEYGLNVGHWFTQSVVVPIAEALLPLKNALVGTSKAILRGVGSLFKTIAAPILGILNPVKVGIFKLFNGILDKFKWGFDKIFKLTGKVIALGVKTMLFPITAAATLASGTHHAIAWKQNAANAAKGFATEFFTGGDIVSSGGEFVKSVINPWSAWDNEELNPNLAAQRKAKKKIKSFAEREQEKYDAEMEDLRKRQKEYKKERKGARKSGYATTEEQIQNRRDKLAAKKAQLDAAAEAAKVKATTPMELIAKNGVAVQSVTASNTGAMVTLMEQANNLLQKILSGGAPTLDELNPEELVPPEETGTEGAQAAVATAEGAGSTTGAQAQAPTTEEVKEATTPPLNNVNVPSVGGVAAAVATAGVQTPTATAVKEATTPALNNVNTPTTSPETGAQAPTAEEVKEATTPTVKTPTGVKGKQITVLPDGSYIMKVNGKEVRMRTKKMSELNIALQHGLTNDMSAFDEMDIEQESAGWKKVGDDLYEVTSGKGKSLVHSIKADSSQNKLSAQNVNAEKEAKRDREIQEEQLENSETSADALKDLVYGPVDKLTSGIFGVLGKGFNLLKDIGSLAGLLLSPMALAGIAGLIGKTVLNGLSFDKLINTEGEGLGQDSRTERFTDRLAKKGIRWGVNGINFAVSAKKAVQSITNNKAKAAAEAGEKMLEAESKKALKAEVEVGSKKVLESKTFLTKAGEIISKVFHSPVVEKVFGKPWIVKAKDLVLGTLKKVAKPAMWAKFLKLFGKKIGIALAKSAAALGTGGTLTAVFAAYDFISGTQEAANLFRVSEEDVDMKMSIIAGIVKAVCGLTFPPFIWIIDLALTFASQMGLLTGIFGQYDHRTWLATQLYEFIAPDEDVKKLEESQHKMDSLYDEYLKTAGLTSEQLTKQQFLDALDGGDSEHAESIRNFSKSKHAEKKYGAAAKNMSESLKTFDQLDNYMKYTGQVKEEAPAPSKERVALQESVKKNSDAEFSELFNKAMDSGTIGAGNAAPQVVNLADNAAGYKYYSQNDPRWKDLPLSPKVPDYGTIGQFGCAPASMAMVVSQLTGKDYDPEDASKSIEEKNLGHGFFSGNTGVKGLNKLQGDEPKDYFYNEAEKAGLHKYSIGPKDDLQKILANGGIAILGGSSFLPSSPFFGSGHYIVVPGLDPTDIRKAFVLNPSSGKNMSYPIATLMDDSIGSGEFAAYFTTSDKRLPGNDGSGAKPVSGDGGPDSVSDAATKGKQIVEIAERYVKVHTPYDLYCGPNAGEPGDPTSCAKFVTDVFSKAGIIIANKTHYVPEIFKFFDSIKGTAPPDTKAEPGDLVIWNFGVEKANGQGGDCAHIGICTGNGKEVIHASGGRHCVVKDPTYDWSAKGYTIKCICKFKAISGKFKGEAYASWMSKKMRSEKGASLIDVFGRLFSFSKDYIMAKLGGQKLSYDEWAAKNPFGGTGETGISGRYVGSELPPEESRANQLKIWEYLTKNLKFPRQVAAALMGNIMRESGFNPGNEGDGGTSLGLFQWHNERKDNLINFAKSRNSSPTDIETQLEFLNKEIGENATYTNMIYDMKNAPSVEAATEMFVRTFERPADIAGESEKRSKYSRGVFDDKTTFVGGAPALYAPNDYSDNPAIAHQRQKLKDWDAGGEAKHRAHYAKMLQTAHPQMSPEERQAKVEEYIAGDRNRMESYLQELIEEAKSGQSASQMRAETGALEKQASASAPNDKLAAQMKTEMQNLKANATVNAVNNNAYQNYKSKAGANAPVQQPQPVSKPKYTESDLKDAENIYRTEYGLSGADLTDALEKWKVHMNNRKELDLDLDDRKAFSASDDVVAVMNHFNKTGKPLMLATKTEASKYNTSKEFYNALRERQRTGTPLRGQKVISRPTPTVNPIQNTLKKAFPSSPTFIANTKKRLATEDTQRRRGFAKPRPRINAAQYNNIKNAVKPKPAVVNNIAPRKSAHDVLTPTPHGDMNDHNTELLISSISKLDAHAEFAQMIVYLKSISEKVGANVGTNQSSDNRGKSNAANNPSAPPKRSTNSRDNNAKNAEKMNENISSLKNRSGQSDASIAYAISSGKPLYEG